MANNPLTDEKKLVELISVQGFWGIFNRVHNAEDGFSLEVFRGNTYLGAILSNEINTTTKSRYQRLGLRNNDTILRINLGYRTLDIKCQLPTRDGWLRPYEGIVKIAVSNPYLFALQYQQASDPVALARLAIEDALKNYARRTDHDSMKDDVLRYDVRSILSQGSHKNYGLQVVEVLASNLYLDAKRAEMLRIKQQGMVDSIQIHVDADNTFTKEQRDSELQDFKGINERRGRSVSNAFGRDEDVLQKQHDRQQAFLNAASEALKQRMLTDISEGVLPEILARRYPQFAAQLGFPSVSATLPPAAQQPLLNNASASSPVDDYADAVTGSYTVVQQPSTPVPPTAPQPFYNARIGAWLVYTSLSDRQRQAWRVSNQTAFMVYMLDTDGVAEQGFMTTGDMIIEIDRQPMQSARVLINALDASQSGTPLTVRVLRGGQPLDLDLDIP